VDIYEREKLDRREVAEWFRKEFPQFAFEENLAAQMYLRLKQNREPDLSGYVRYTVTPLSDLMTGIRSTVKVLLVGMVPRTERSYPGCPNCWLKATQTLKGWECKEHGIIDEPVMRYSVDMVGSDGTVKEPMRFAFLPWAIARALESGKIQSYKELIAIPVTLNVQFSPEEKANVNDILAVGEDNSHMAVPGVEVETLAPQAPAPTPKPAMKPLAPQPMKTIAQPSVAPIEPETVTKQAMKLLDTLKELTVGQFKGWIATLQAPLDKLEMEAIVKTMVYSDGRKAIIADGIVKVK